MSTLLLGCPEQTGAGSVVDSGLPDSGSEPIDAGPPVPPPPRELLLELSADGGVETIDGVTSIDPVQQLDVRISVALTDYRLRVLDDGDKLVPSDDEASVSDGGIDYRIVFSEPLKPGRKYVLMVDAQTGSVLDDTSGRPYQDLELKLKTRGERVPDPKPGKPTKSKKRR